MHVAWRTKQIIILDVKKTEFLETLILKMTVGLLAIAHIEF